jgi:hypothetical protein
MIERKARAQCCDRAFAHGMIAILPTQTFHRYMIVGGGLDQPTARYVPSSRAEPLSVPSRSP